MVPRQEEHGTLPVHIASGWNYKIGKTTNLRQRCRLGALHTNVIRVIKHKPLARLILCVLMNYAIDLTFSNSSKNIHCALFIPRNILTIAHPIECHRL